MLALFLDAQVHLGICDVVKELVEFVAFFLDVVDQLLIGVKVDGLDLKFHFLLINVY